MELIKYEFKHVRLTYVDGRTFIGYVGDYIYPEDNEPEVEGIILDNLIRDDGYKYESPVRFNKPEIVSIEAIV